MSVHTFGPTFQLYRLLSAGLLVCSVPFSASLHAIELKKVDQVLATEAAGKPIDRREALADQKDEVSQWQSGRILVQGQWMELEGIQDHKLASQIELYRKQRDARTLDIDGHRSLAKWCQSHQLPEMANVHWKAVVALAIDDEQARKALSHKRIGGKWFTREELQLAAEEQSQLKQGLKKWMPYVRRLVNNLQSNDSQLKLEGLRELESINTADAVEALKNGTLQVDPSVALPLVSKIKSIRSKESCLALCEIALVDPNSEPGRLAIDGLKEYDEHFYVPELLQMLELPTELKQEMFNMPNGSVAVRKAYVRENMTEIEQTEVLKMIAVRRNINNRSQFMDVEPARLAFSPWIQDERPSRASQQTFEKLAALEIKSQRRETDSQNSIAEFRQQNTKLVLARVANLPEDASVRQLWDWWPSFNENPTLAAKVLSQRSYTDSTGAVPRYDLSVERPLILPSECLASGTLVQTSEGLKSVEKLGVGDLVAAMNVESGKIEFSPITFVSTRDVDSSYLLKTATGELIRATGGHRWWVVGKGWQRSRELKAGQFMRTGDSSVEITKVEKIDEPIKVYNMIVDQNHTYFVGKDRLLSWDVTSLQPTLQTAPGQSKQMYVSAK